MSTFDQLIKKAEKDWNCPELMDLAKAPRSSKIPFSSPLMNWVCYGGIPRNRITEFHGAPGGGKSTSAIDICKNAHKIFQQEYEEQVADYREKAAKDKKNYSGPLADLLDRGPKKVLYIDLEHAFDNEWSKVLGINDDEIKIMTPPDQPAEDILQLLQELICTGEVGMVVLDSIPSLVTRAELDKKYGERTVSALAGLLTIFCRKIVSLLDRYQCTMIFINQIRENMDNPYVVATPGGQAPKFYASLRILFQVGNPVDFLGNELPKNTENPAGYIINAKLVKQKSAPFNRKNGSYYLMSDSGIREDFDFAKLAVTKYDIIHKSAGWFTPCDPFTGEVFTTPSGSTLKVNGMAAVYEYLKANPDYYNKLKKYILDDINGDTSTECDVAEEDETPEVIDQTVEENFTDDNVTDEASTPGNTEENSNGN